MPNYFIICPCEAKMNTMLKIGNTVVLTRLSLFLQKKCKTSVVFNVHCSKISTIWDRVKHMALLINILIL